MHALLFNKIIMIATEMKIIIDLEKTNVAKTGNAKEQELAACTVGAKVKIDVIDITITMIAP